MKPTPRHEVEFPPPQRPPLVAGDRDAWLVTDFKARSLPLYEPTCAATLNQPHR